VNTAIYSPSGAYAGIGFAVPVDTVNRVVPQLIRRGRYMRPRLGIYVNDRVAHSMSIRLGVEGLPVLHVEPDSAAAAAGLRGIRRAPDGTVLVGDIIRKLGEHEVRNTNDLFMALDRHGPGDRVTLTVLRDGKEIRVDVVLR
jgi:S1-C subfamily serine protease